MLILFGGVNIQRSRVVSNVMLKLSYVAVGYISSLHVCFDCITLKRIDDKLLYAYLIYKHIDIQSVILNQCACSLLL